MGLPEGTYYVKVIIEYAGGRSKPYFFRLTNKGVPRRKEIHSQALSLRESKEAREYFKRKN